MHSTESATSRESAPAPAWPVLILQTAGSRTVGSPGDVASELTEFAPAAATNSVNSEATSPPRRPLALHLLSGSLSTDGSGNVTDNFTAVEAWTVTTGYTAAGFAPAPVIEWYLNDNNEVFADQTREFSDAAGGTQMAPEFWSAPRPFSGRCVATARSSSAAPALGAAALLLLASLLGAVGVARLANRGT